MEVTSEKVFYEREVKEQARRLDIDILLWGEELYDKKIVIYPKKISAISGYEDIKKDLVDAALVYFDFKKEKYMKLSIIRYDEAKKVLYVSEENFNGIWRYLRNSVDLGIRIQKKRKNEIAITTPDDIVDLSFLHRTGSEAVIENGQLTYIAKEIPQSEKELLGRKQSLLDNAKYLYFYDEDDNIYHDKDCERVKEILPARFKASENRPGGKRPCKKCRRRMFLRKSCSPYVKQIPQIDRLLTKAGITDYQLEKFAYEEELKFKTDQAWELTVKGKEDTWIIKGFQTMELSLWHNNYVKTAPRERYITQGFHNQGMDGKKLCSMLTYISGYTFEKHLAGEEKAALIKSVEPLEEVKEQVVTEQREGFFASIIEFIKRMFGK